MATVIGVKDLHKSFAGVDVLKGVSFSADDGDVVAIVGSSGSGKSTLLRCIPMLEVPDGGEIAISGEVVRTRQTSRGGVADERQVNHIRRDLGFVFQSFNLWSHLTILGNIIEAPVHVHGRPKSECITEAEALLDKVGIADKRHAYPSELSGGQQQRAAIARALATRPKALLFDEPTSALDPELVGEVLRVIRQLAEEGRTMLIVTHEMRFAREVSNRAIFLHQGRIEEEGTPDSVFGQPSSERCRQFLANHLNG